MDASGHDRVKWEETRHRKRESRPVLQTKHCKKGLVRAQTQASDPKVRVWAKPVRPVLPVIGPRCKIRKQKFRREREREQSKRFAGSRNHDYRTALPEHC